MSRKPNLAGVSGTLRRWQRCHDAEALRSRCAGQPMTSSVASAGESAAGRPTVDRQASAKLCSPIRGDTQRQPPLPGTNSHARSQPRLPTAPQVLGSCGTRPGPDPGSSTYRYRPRPSPIAIPAANSAPLTKPARADQCGLHLAGRRVDRLPRVRDQSHKRNSKIRLPARSVHPQGHRRPGSRPGPAGRDDRRHPR